MGNIRYDEAPAAAVDCVLSAVYFAIKTAELSLPADVQRVYGRGLGKARDLARRTVGAAADLLLSSLRRAWS